MSDEKIHTRLPIYNRININLPNYGYSTKKFI